MLVLSRKRNEVIRIGDAITVVVVDIRGDKVRIGIKAPKDVPVHRQEVYESSQRHGVDRKKPGFTGLDMSELPLSAEDMLDDAAETSEFRTIMAEAEGANVMAEAGLVDEVPTVDVGAVLQEIANCRKTIHRQVGDYVCGAAVRNELRKMELLMAELAGMQL